jgi:hypothetical protein
MDSIRSLQESIRTRAPEGLTTTRAHSLVVELARAGAFSSSDILPVVQEFENTRHAEFKERNAWNCTKAAPKS